MIHKPTYPPPGWLGPVGVDYWNAAVSSVDGITEVHLPLLSLYCHSWQVFHEARQIIEREGLTACVKNGAVYSHPAVGIQHKASEQVRKLAAMFGMGSATRGKKSRQRYENPIDAMLREHLGRG